ncbi:hypothetical protein C8J57DRAFT_1519300 [Mycena rebaudengoi]|nr:hypothetical protein C8J57DRAFT_1519300 [Mycena rebaudengoi]
MLKEIHLVGDSRKSSDDGPDGKFILLLTRRAEENDTVLCPRLQHITLDQVEALSDPALLAFIRARTGPHLTNIAYLSSVCVSFSRAKEVDIRPQLLASRFILSLKYFASMPPPILYSPFEATESYLDFPPMSYA